MRFSRNIGHPKLPPTQLQNFERDFWNVYLDRIFNLMLSYHQSSKDTDKMSDVANHSKLISATFGIILLIKKWICRVPLKYLNKK
jgi:hypothetical protein